MEEDWFTCKSDITLEELMELLTNGGARLADPKWHFVGNSDKHLQEFFDFERMFDFQNAWRLAWIIRALGTAVVNHGFHPTTLVGPAEGGNILAQRLADRLAETANERGGLQVVLTKKIPQSKEFCFHNFQVNMVGKRVLVIDDVMTTGLAARNTVKICREAGAEVLGIFVVIDREGRTAEELGVPQYGYLASVNAVSYNVPYGEICALCKERIDIDVTIGHGAEFVALHGQPSSWSPEKYAQMMSGTSRAT